MSTRTRNLAFARTATLLLLAMTRYAVGQQNMTTRELDAYTLSKGPITVAGVQDNLSGITWCGATKTLFAVQNAPTQVLELTPDGDLKRTIALTGFDDTEGIAWLGGSRFAVLEERLRQLVIFDITATTTRVAHREAKVHTVEPKPADNSRLNNGLEGIASIVESHMVFICVEKSPRKVYQLNLQKGTETKPEITIPWDAQQLGLGLSDLAGMTGDASTGHLLLLSDESKTLVEITTQGKEISRLPLDGKAAGLDAPIPQPEGVALDGDGKLYIVSEPNLLYIFARK